MSNGLDSEQDRQNVGPVLGPAVFKSSQQMTDGVASKGNNDMSNSENPDQASAHVKQAGLSFHSKAKPA